MIVENQNGASADRRKWSERSNFKPEQIQIGSRLFQTSSLRVRGGIRVSTTNRCECEPYLEADVPRISFRSGCGRAFVASMDEPLGRIIANARVSACA
jgi:hypothetical protein